MRVTRGGVEAARTPFLAVLTAAGSGTRLGCEGPKALVELAGEPMLTRAARALVCGGCRGIAVTAPSSHLSDFAHLLLSCPSLRLMGTADEGPVPGSSVPVRVVAGGGSRQASVAAGMAVLPSLAVDAGVSFGASTPVLVHDAARPLVPAVVVERVVAAVVAGAGAVIPVLAVADTLKSVAGTRTFTDPGGATLTTEVVGSTLDRSLTRAVQTPQGFTWELLREAHAAGERRAGSETTAATDDAGLVEALGRDVHMVDGDPLSLKVTTPMDLRLAELLCETSSLHPRKGDRT